MKSIPAYLCSGLLSLVSLEAAFAGQYVPGIEGVKAAVAPPPGVYYRGYLVHYDADKSDALPAESQVTVDALASRFIWISEQKVLGGDLGFEAILPLVNTDLQIGQTVKDEQTSFADFFVGSLIGWHGERWHSVAAAGVWSATGSSNQPADAGAGYAEIMLTLGGTAYLTADKTWSASLLSRYEIKDSSQAEDEVVAEWGLGHHQGLLDVGLVGYSRWELGDGQAETHALGVSVGYFWPQLMLGLDAAAYQEYEVTQGFEGEKFRIALTKVL